MCHTGEPESHAPHWNGNTSVRLVEKHKSSETKKDFGPASSNNEDPTFGYTYQPNPTLEESSLSVRLMHRPSRAQNEYEKASDPTKQNSAFNAYVDHAHASDPLSSPETSPSQGERGSSLEMSPPIHPAKFSLVRKKSGEIVKSLLKGNGTPVSVRSLSLPSTPTYKQVHFGGDNDVRYFKKKDRPAAISASGSPQECEDDDDDDEIPSLDHEGSIGPFKKSYFEYYDDELNTHSGFAQNPAGHHKSLSEPASLYDWELSSSNLSQNRTAFSIIQSGKQVFLENLFLSGDKRCLLGTIAVFNLTFHKSVFVRYSVDQWSTVVEIQANYVPDGSPILKKHNYDRFMFKIPLDSFCNGFHSNEDPLDTSPADLSSELCVRYLANDIELWDNNDGENYLFNLTRKVKKENISKNIPSGARTKQEVHEKRPKYSSSYLKRIKSDSSISKQMRSLDIESEQQPAVAATPPNSSSSTSVKRNFESDLSRGDFENNNFYLSSPLLSSLSNKDQPENLREMTLHKTSKQPAPQNSSSSAAHSPEQTESGKEVAAEQGGFRKFSSDYESGISSPLSKHLQEPMSYKAFLDSYCFFNPTLNDNSSKTTLVLSEEPSTTADENTQVNRSTDPAYTVSSFLT